MKALGHSDIHYLVAFLYVVARTTDISVCLGDRIFDEASESDRDVDIVIATAGAIALAGVEVKDEGRPLDVTLVEALCLKLNDMPSLRSRAIVSTSGYTAPARKKAAAHGVSLLTLVQGKIPPFRTVNLSRLSEITLAYPDWVRGPAVHLEPGLHLSGNERAALCDSTPIAYPAGIAADVSSVKQLADRIVARVTCDWPADPQAPGESEVRIQVKLQDHPSLVLPSRTIPIRNAIITGVVRVTQTSVPLTAACYLATESGEPFAAAALVATRAGLLGFAVAPNTNELRAFHIPEALRDKRPHRQKVFEAL